MMGPHLKSWLPSLPSRNMRQGEQVLCLRMLLEQQGVKWFSYVLPVSHQDGMTGLQDRDSALTKRHFWSETLYFIELWTLQRPEAIYLGKGRMQKKKIVEFSSKVGGWGQQWTDFPLFFFWKKIWAYNTGCWLRIILRHIWYFQFLGGGPFSAWILVRRVCQTFKAL